MDGRSLGATPVEALAAVGDALDVLTVTDLRLVTESQLMAMMQSSLVLTARLQAWQAQLAATVERREVAWHEHATSTSTWLAEAARLTRREAGRLIGHGEGLCRFPLVAEAARAGSVQPAQAEAIVRVLTDLPDEVDADQREKVQATMVGFAATHNSSELRRLGRHLLDVVAPEQAEQLEADKVEREYRQACRNRYLSFSYDHQGSVLFRGSLPVVDGEAFMRQIHAHAAQLVRGIEAFDPATRKVAGSMRRADALVALVHAHQQRALAPNHGGDRPRIVITFTHGDLLRAAGDERVRGRLADTAERLPVGVLRQALCDGDVMPMVLGGRSGVLDVGRSERLVTPDQRAALQPVTTAACSPAATSLRPAARPITSCPGGRAVAPILATWCCSAHTITASSNRVTIPTPTDGRCASTIAGWPRSFRRAGSTRGSVRACTCAVSRSTGPMTRVRRRDCSGDEPTTHTLKRNSTAFSTI